jgi:tRNA(Ile)-lysidine synthase
VARADHADRRSCSRAEPGRRLPQAGFLAALPEWQARASARTLSTLDRLLPHCTFPRPGRDVACAFSGGPDSTALIALAKHHGLVVTAHHVDHGIRPESGDDARRARDIARGLGVEFVLHHAGVPPGPNLEARARTARLARLPADAMTGHTLDDQAETLLVRLLRGSGTTGLAAIEPGPRHPLLALRRSDTESICEDLGIDPVRDPTNDAGSLWRSRIRHELLPLASSIAARDVAPILARTADLLRSDDQLLDELAADIDASDARAVAAAHPVLARRALRRWLTIDGYPPDAAAIDRVLDVAHGRAGACELPGGRRLERSRQRFRIVEQDG